MRHGHKLPKLSRPTAHRNLMLRNLVSSLLEHEQITTTLAKAKAAQKLADQVIQWGKAGGKGDWERANAFLLNAPKTLRPLFTTLAQRYATRPGGYTRIARAGFRVGDRAPLAVLELVDNRNDLRYELAAHSLGRELAILARPSAANPEGDSGTWSRFKGVFEQDGPDGVATRVGECAELDEMTRKNVVKALQFRTAPLPVDSASLESAADAESVPAGEVDASSSSSPSTSAAATAEVTATHPSTLFLARAYHHYLSTLASFTLASRPVPDAERTVKQLTQRLRSAVLETKGAPRPVLTVPQVGRREKAGERTEGWEGRAEEVVVKKGPIGLAKGKKGRQPRFERSAGGQAEFYGDEEAFKAEELRV
ncbi:hypothetical protein JCM10213_002856 [Rhodosporidiobolus nylandii]